ncbi:MAG: DUF4381 domain-containing protein [Geminicoccaceae bacterium]
MTPKQILAGLRDIHLPEATSDAAAVDLALWPLVLVLLAALLIAWMIWRRRSIWRRDFIHHLDRIEDTMKEQGEIEGWTGLARLVRRLAIQHQGRSEIAGLSGEPWLERLDDVVGSDLFTKGPGRGLITSPYQGADLDDDTARRMGDDLKATIEALRKRTFRYGTAR